MELIVCEEYARGDPVTAPFSPSPTTICFDYIMPHNGFHEVGRVASIMGDGASGNKYVRDGCEMFRV